MKRLWKYPFSREQYFPPILIFGPLVSWYYLLINDLFFNGGKNALKIVLTHMLLILTYFKLLQIVKLKDYSAKEVLLYMGFNFAFLILISSFEKILLGKKMDFYKSQDGKFNNAFLNGLIIIIPLSISIILGQLFSYFSHLIH